MLLSLFAAVAAVLVRVLTDLPAAAILVPVVIIGFTLSWFAAGRAPNGPANRRNGPAR
ncbi:MAG: hypothetical protein ABW328_01085 [Ilumatobacteraceae bacterium]